MYRETRSGRIDTGKLDRPEHLPSSASEFRARDRRSLNIDFVNARDSGQLLDNLPQNIIADEYLMMGGLTRDQLYVIDHQPTLKEQIIRKEGRTLASYMNQVLINDPLTTGVRETLTDSFVNYLLTKLEFNEEPFLMNLQSDYCFTVNRTTVNAKIEFTIEKDKGILCFDEDKHFHGHAMTHAYEYGESQMAAEILACAYTNFDRSSSPMRGQDQTIFAIRVIGSRFTFYKAFISADYCESLIYGFPPDSKRVTVLRYPSNENHFYGYDYADENLRQSIIHLLLRLREQIKTM